MIVKTGTEATFGTDDWVERDGRAAIAFLPASSMAENCRETVSESRTVIMCLKPLLWYLDSDNAIVRCRT